MKPIICIVGLGYVGLPLAYAFAREGYDVRGFDISEGRIAELQSGKDRTRELTAEELKSVNIVYGIDPAMIKEADVIIVAVPTPVDDHHKPDLSFIESSAHIVGKNLKKGAIVVYEATVYPGVTEEVCGSIIEQESGLKCGVHFTLGYSPERINPGDKLHTVSTIVKIVAGQDEKTLNTLTQLYGSIVKAGIHKAPSIKVAEMAKAIENAQRDINIAYINEIAMLCNHLGIRTKDVLDAAGTKWNFLQFQPGLVGGHCIGVDPYYLVEKAKQLGMDTQLITAGRSINDGMALFIADRVIKALPHPAEARVLILGMTFKENVPDTRNSKVHDVIAALTARVAQVDVHDPFLTDADIANMQHSAGDLQKGPYDAVLLLVPHREYLDMPADQLVNSVKEGGVLFDLKSILDPQSVTKSGRTYLSL